MDTIFASSGGQPPAAIGIVRVSGPQARAALQALSGRVPAPRQASLAALHDPVNGEQIDRALLLWFPGPRTATGEDLAEFHCHGGRAVIAAILSALERLPGLRLAQPGEFTRRAFENGRMDLNAAEGLADLLMAETESQRRAALAMAEGGFSRQVALWEAQLLRLSALTEAALDFSDEDDVPGEGIEAQIVAQIRSLRESVASESGRPHAERLRDGIRVVLAGPPNVGKSTLLNALAERDAAIVSPIAGTTRDRIEVPVAIGGTAFLLTDTAGLRAETTDVIEAIGIDRAAEAIAAADILLWLGKPDEAPEGAVRIAPRMDDPGFDGAGADLCLSAVSGEGMNSLRHLLIKMAATLLPGEGDYALHARQREAVGAMIAALDETLNHADDMLIVAEGLRAARGAIDALTGRSGTEAMLDALFGNFCIGK
ncbi:tRNA uridine-5-carboxymethylaminomethyl(34) synthesis GTPase MnmE [Sphingobium sp. H39-3-25]|uniref:tRNA uridine-5-carboxymethylaminomethyl(34) synthesis GTPase MnmE n=1 Tax=Sphingobium arseniciresistens TaxID=3030834 RepID=UPI0023B9F776|nr:tRNA uridine-5-carboxymethylaminomethyl(34) synthesis GTPase MnmE [Sphingobium arseniciresistens]